MKVGDLVKMKWTTFASKRRAKRQGFPADEVGLVVEEAHGAAKIAFPSQGSKMRTLLKINLEVVNEEG